MTDVLECFMDVGMSHNFSDCTLYVPLVRCHPRLGAESSGSGSCSFRLSGSQEYSLCEGHAVQPQ